MSARSASSARGGSGPSRGVAPPRPGPRCLARVAMAFCLFAAANGQNVAGEGGTFVDVTPNVQTQLDGRFGTAPSHRSGHTMVRPPAEPRRASRRPAVPPRAESWCSFRARRFFFLRRADSRVSLERDRTTDGFLTYPPASRLYLPRPSRADTITATETRTKPERNPNASNARDALRRAWTRTPRWFSAAWVWPAR